MHRVTNVTEEHAASIFRVKVNVVRAWSCNTAGVICGSLRILGGRVGGEELRGTVSRKPQKTTLSKDCERKIFKQPGESQSKENKTTQYLLPDITLLFLVIITTVFPVPFTVALKRASSLQFLVHLSY
jgi:hypothetical protein